MTPEPDRSTYTFQTPLIECGEIKECAALVAQVEDVEQKFDIFNACMIGNDLVHSDCRADHKLLVEEAKECSNLEFIKEEK